MATGSKQRLQIPWLASPPGALATTPKQKLLLFSTNSATLRFHARPAGSHSPAQGAVHLAHQRDKGVNPSYYNPVVSSKPPRQGGPAATPGWSSLCSDHRPSLGCSRSWLFPHSMLPTVSWGRDTGGPLGSAVRIPPIPGSWGHTSAPKGLGS